MLRTALTRRRKHTRRGMTLIEIIVVITILSLLMAAVGVAVIPQLEQAKVDRAKMDIGNIQNALKTYYAKKGNYPDTGVGLKALVDAQILERPPLDPWDTEYVYMKEGSTPVIISYGRDKAPGGTETDADISSKELGQKKAQ
ncbi:MAG: type II secretion system protein GspG [Myxococcales bacterium]|nr:type II secretion system protein GspG [Myxococcales bacterium]MDP3505533.1 type II secretion system protein GspG [Myxococcales bacterium]